MNLQTIITDMDRFAFFSLKKIGTAFLVFAGFLIVFFSVSRAKESSFGGSASLSGIAHADVPVITSSAADGSSGGDSGDDGGGDSGDSGGK